MTPPQRPLHLRFVALNYAPDALGNAPLTTALARGLAALGHRVEVLTAWPHHDRGRHPTGAGRDLGPGTDGAVQLWRVPVPDPARGGRALTHAAFAAWALAAALRPQLGPRRASPPPDAVVVPLPPLSAVWAAAATRARFGAAVVLDVQDVFPHNLALATPRAAPQAGKLAARLATPLARRAYAAADHLRTLGPAAAAALEALGVPPDRLTAIPNPADTHRLGPAAPGRPPVAGRAAPGAALRAALSPDGAPVALLSGRLGSVLDLPTLARAWTTLQARWRATDGPAPWLALVGAGSAAAAAEALAAHLPRARFLPLVPAEHLGDLLRAAAVGVVPLRPGAARASLPSRLLNLWACARPTVLSAEPDTDAAAQLRATGAGAVVPPGDPEALAAALYLRLASPALAAQEGAAGHAWVHAHATPERVAARWSELLGAAVARRQAEAHTPSPRPPSLRPKGPR